MSDIPQVAIDRAVEAAEATSTRRHLRDEAARAAYMTRLREVFESGGPIIAEAAVEGEREKTRLRIKAIVPYPSDGPGAEAVYRFKAKLLAAIDKEGEQDAPEDR